ncbi:MAG: T9SS type A sorting domain-containing protein [Bacteroidetes bacterium]|nr:T9SS type A sorting domain-containing protein [Bacteroidota bacterium]
MPTSSEADQNKYQAPSALALNTWGNTIVQIVSGNYHTAQDSAAKIQYRVVQFNETTTTPSKTYYVLEKTSSGTNYWGVFVYNPVPLRGKLFIQSPHPIYDLNTGKQGIQIFKNIGARSWFVSGTHRCNSTVDTECDGTTSVCGGHYKISDQAHVVEGTLQRATIVMNSLISQMIVIQNHGFGRDSTVDPYVIMGNGKTTNPTGTDYLLQVKNNLSSLDGELTFKVVHVDIGWTKLAGTSNTQGRLINGSASPCNTPPASANGRFLHIEQAKERLRDTDANRKKLSDAIALTFAQDALTLTSPNGEERYSSGSQQTITWNSSGLISNVKLEYTIDNGVTWNIISADVPNSGSYNWTVPNVGTWKAKVRITDAENSSVGDTSSAKFKIDYAVFPTTGTSAFVTPAAPFGSRKLNGVYDFHRGIDYAGELNTPIHPIKAGVVVRLEDTTQTAGKPLQRFGNWMLIKIDSSDGTVRHNAYLHLNAFHKFGIGDTVSTRDTVGFMGKSGYQINTIHSHVELYKNLNGVAIDKDKAVNPMEVLPYVNTDNYTASIVAQAESSYVIFETPNTEIDFNEIIINGSNSSRTINFNSRTGIDPSNNDNPNYNNVFIDPDSFTKDSSIQRIRFWIKNSEIGAIQSAVITDVKGNSINVEKPDETPRFAVASGNWNAAIWSATENGVAGSASVPSSTNNVMVNAGITVTVNTSSAACKSISFGSTSSKLSFASSSKLSVYGNFTLYSASHNAVSSWAEGAKLCFKGSSPQLLSGWSTTSSTTVNTTLMEVQVDKSGDTLRTPGTDMKLALGTSLEILYGVFLLDSADDINGKSLDGSSASKPLFLIQTGGEFIQRGGAHHIRSGTSGTNPVGSMTVFGKVQLASTSSLGLNFDSVTVGSGGNLILNSFSNLQPNNIALNKVTIYSGGIISNNSTVNFWNAGTIVNLNAGALYKVGASTTIFPPYFTNNGTVQYSRTAGDGSQTITDMNYSSLSINSTGIKNWNLASSRAITDTLEIINGTLQLTFSNQTLSIQKVLNLQNDTLITGTNLVSLGTSTANRGELKHASGMIVGKFQRWFSTETADSIVFPIGTSGKLRPAAVSFTVAPSSGGTITAFYTSSSPGTNGLPLNDNGVSILNITNDGYWSLNSGNGLDGGIYSLALSLNNTGGIQNISELRILKRETGGAWTLQGTHAEGVSKNSLITARRSGLSGFSEFVVGGSEDNPLPVQLATFSLLTSGSKVELKWETYTEIINRGFEVQRLCETTSSSEWITVGFVNGKGMSSLPQKYSFTDLLPEGGKYLYRLKQLNSNGSFTYSEILETKAGVMPKVLKIFPNYPNPFNPSTTIEFTVSQDGETSLIVYNSLGQVVQELFHGVVSAGYLQRTTFNASRLPSGIYFVHLKSQNQSSVSKILFLK